MENHDRESAAAALPNTEDERYQVVEDAIKGAFLLLVKEKDPQKITVSDVIRKAGIVRSTFYNHYTDMPALIHAMEDETILHVFDMMESFHPKGSREITYTFFLSLCRYTMQNTFLAAMLKSPLAPDFVAKMIKMFHIYAGSVRDSAPAAVSPEEFSFAIAYTIGGAIGFLHKWTVDGFKQTPETIAGILTDLFANGVLSYL